MGLLRKNKEEPKKEVKAKEQLPTDEPQQTEGKFSLNENEMALAVNALAERPELKVYNDFIVGQAIAKILEDYNKTVGKKEGLLPTDEDGLPE